MTVRRIRKLMAWVLALVVIGLIVAGVAAVAIYATGGSLGDLAIQTQGVAT